MSISTIPPEFLADIENALKHPEQFKYSGWNEGDNRIKSVRENTAVIPAVLREDYDRFHSRAMAHSMSKGQHEAAGLLNFYVIWKYKLWRADSYRSWDEYVRDSTNMPFSISATSLKTGVADIHNFVERGMEFGNIINVMGLTRTAARLLTDVPDEQLPGGDINSAAQMIVELGPGEAIAAVNDWTGKQTYHGLSGIHDKTQERCWLEVKRTRIDGAWDRLNFMITDIDAEAANWLMERCQIRGDRRVFK